MKTTGAELKKFYNGSFWPFCAAIEDWSIKVDDIEIDPEEINLVEDDAEVDTSGVVWIFGNPISYMSLDEFFLNWKNTHADS